VLARLVEDAGLGAYREPLVRMALPAVRFRTEPSSRCAIGESRIGGAPDVPSDFRWPEFGGQPLAFIAQLDLAQFAAGSPLGDLPLAGWLLFFYDARQQTWGFDPNDRGSAAVVYLPPDTVARPRPLPDPLNEEGRFGQCAVRDLRTVLTLPGYDSPLVEALAFSKAEQSSYVDNVLQSLNAEGQVYHQLGGHAEPIQSDMQLECQLASHGIYCGNPAGYQDPRRAALEPGSVDWRLLLQIDSDDNAQMMWGDVGRLYYWTRKQDLAARRFRDSWLILQCC
jgi:uncharacterized protein YwqG